MSAGNPTYSVPARIAVALGLMAVVAMTDGCAAGIGSREPMQFDLRGPIAPAAAGALTPSEAPRNFARLPLNEISGPAFAAADPVLLASSEASAAAADPSLQADGF